jgi:hypothetical protein
MSRKSQFCCLSSQRQLVSPTRRLIIRGETQHLQDFNGHYNVGAAGTRGVTLGAGKTGTIMSNQAGVIVRVSSTQQGIAVNATGGGVDMQLK